MALLGPEFVTDNADEAIYALGKVALPTFMVKLLVIAVLTSAAASCQTTILPATRTMLSMGSHGAAPAKLARIDPKRLTPDFSTWLFGIVSIVWYLLLVVISHNTDTDAYSASIAAVGMAIAVYYGLSGISCIVYYRRFLLKSPKNFVLIGCPARLRRCRPAVRVLQDRLGRTQRRLRLRHAVRRRHRAGDRHAVARARHSADVLVLEKYPKFFGYRPDPPDLVKDPNSDDTLAAPLGTYTKAGKSMAGDLIVGVGGDGQRLPGGTRGRPGGQPDAAPRSCSCSATSRSPWGRAAARSRSRSSPSARRRSPRSGPSSLATYPALTIEVELVSARPVDALIEVAAARDAEAIAVGHGGSGPLQAALLGSITYEIVHRSPMPVLVVPNDEADEA